MEISATENDGKKLSLFIKSLDKEIPGPKNLNYLRLYFEKTLEYNCDNEEIWQKYITFIKKLIQNKTHDFKINEKEYLLSIIFRATKCCYFSVELWKILILELESNYYPKEFIQSN